MVNLFENKLIGKLQSIDFDPDNHVQAVLETLNELKKEIEVRMPDLKPALFWDYDGTIINGDMTEGIDPHYKGLAHWLITQGHIEEFSGEEGYQQFLRIYEEKIEQLGEREAYLWLSEPFHTDDQQKLLHFLDQAKKYFTEVLEDHHFESSLAIIEGASRLGISSYIISASPQIFIKSAKDYLSLEEHKMVGMLPTGTVRSEFTYSESENKDLVPYAEGKREILHKILDRDKVYPIGGFGNSWVSDGPFIKAIIEKGGLGVMINAGQHPSQDPSGFLCVMQKKRIKSIED